MPLLLWGMLLIFQAEDPPAESPLRLQQPPAGSTDESEDVTEKQRQWLLAQRVVHGKLNREQTDSLQAQFAKLNPAQVNVLVMVYEQHYGATSPFGRAGSAATDSTEALLEWMVAYRIVRDRLTVEQAKAFGEQLRSMSPSQVRILADAYRQQAERDKHKPRPAAEPTGEEKQAATNLQAAQERMEFEQMTRQLALGRASDVRSAQATAQQSAISGAAAAAQAATDRFNSQQAFGQSMYEQNTDRSYWRSGAGYWWGW